MAAVFAALLGAWSKACKPKNTPVTTTMKQQAKIASCIGCGIDPKDTPSLRNIASSFYLFKHERLAANKPVGQFSVSAAGTLPHIHDFGTVRTLVDKTITSTDIYGNHYTVSINQLRWRPAAYAIVIRDRTILLTKQHGSFHLPGGGIEIGEMPEAAVIREAREETGFIIANPQLVGELSGFFTQSPEHIHVQSLLLYYRCDVVGGQASTDGFEDDEKATGEMPEWVPIERLDSIPSATTVNWQGMVKKALANEPA